MIYERAKDYGEDWSKMSIIELLYDKEHLDEVRAEGEAKGKAEGKAEGEAEGEAKGIAKTIDNILKQHADWTDEKIADLLGVEMGFVQQVRRDFTIKQCLRANAAWTNENVAQDLGCTVGQVEKVRANMAG